MNGAAQCRTLVEQASAIGVWGSGLVGLSVARFLRQHGFQGRLLLYDERPVGDAQRKELQQFSVQVYASEDRALFLASIELLIPSPGVNPVKWGSAQVISEVDLFVAYWQRPWVAITGTVGKTTVTTMLGRMGMRHGARVAIGGNIGIPLLDLVDQKNVDCAVVELSSFQLETSMFCNPRVALITNLFPNHLDRHGSLEAYRAAKYRISRAQTASDLLILPLSLYMDHCAMVPDYAGTRWVWCDEELSGEHSIAPSDAVVWIDQERILCRIGQGDVFSIGAVPQQLETYPENYCALAAAWYAWQQVSCSWDALLEDRPRYRLVPLGTYGGITFFNDSKATVPVATQAAVRSCAAQGPLVLFLGGVSKGVDRTPFLRNLEPVPRLCVCFGAEAEALAEPLRERGIRVLIAPTLEAAVAEYLEQRLIGDVVLFSPSGASFDLFTDFEARGARFAELVAQFAATCVQS